MRIIDNIHRKLKTERGFRYAVATLPQTALGQPVQGAFYEPGLITLVTELPWVKNRNIVSSRLERKKRLMSVRDLNGLWAGKSPPGTPHDTSYETFLDYGRALKSSSEYTLPNRIGYDTDEDFEANCTYLRGKLAWIAATKDGIPVVNHRTWDNTYYLVNIDGGNHFAAVYRQCIEQDRDFTFECRIEHHSLNVDECKKAISETSFLIVPTAIGQPLATLIAEFGQQPRPTCYEFQKAKSLLVFGWRSPKVERLSQIVLETLPPKCYFDLRSYIQGLLI